MNYQELRKEVLSLPKSYRNLLLNDLIRGYNSRDKRQEDVVLCRQKYEYYLDVFCKILGDKFDKELIQSHSRIRPNVFVRMIAFVKLRHDGFSPCVVANATRFTPASVYHAAKVVQEALLHPNRDPEVYNLYTQFIDRLKDAEDIPTERTDCEG